MTGFELLPFGNSETAGVKSLTWSSPDVRQPHHVDTRLGPWFEQWGSPSDSAVGLARVAAAVFLADRMVRRNPLRQRRDIDLLIWVPEVQAMEEVSDDLVKLLSWLTGDAWTLRFREDTSTRPAPTGAYPTAPQVSLLSGGLDSFCGALITGVQGRLFLSHSDSSGIKRSQNDVTAWLDQHFSLPEGPQVRLAPPPKEGREPSRRSRSFLFIGLAVCLADAVGAPSVEIPENGFTSLNVPLAANRGGVLTTRSTHPWTFHLLGRVLIGLGLPVTLANPFEYMTKGELVRAAIAATSAATVRSGIPLTLSCAKSNPILRGSGSGHNCGLDYACIVRRAGVATSGVVDDTEYLISTLSADVLPELVSLRQADISAVRLALYRGANLTDLMSSDPFPPGYDLGQALGLWERGLEEMSNVALP